ncbi:MAG: hypothetical protein NTZ64_09590 [Polaromonas sp.]|nr:hypothetical protein [Polaromonas sp.]
MSTKTLKWLADVQESNYPAAASYLSLLLPASDAESLVAKLKAASQCEFKAKDIFRASGLSLLGISNSHVEKDRQKIKAGTALSPILLVRGDPFSKVIVADGYHRLCAVYSIDEDAWIPCKIV